MRKRCLTSAQAWPLLDFLNLMTYTLHDPCYWETRTAFHTAWSDCVKAVNWWVADRPVSLYDTLGHTIMHAS